MRTRAYDFLDTDTNTPWYGVECFVRGKWMSLYDKEKGAPVLFATKEDRDANRKELRRLRSEDF